MTSGSFNRNSALIENTANPASKTGIFHVMAKPTSWVCNIRCKYCFYLQTEKLYPDTRNHWRMNDETLELYVKQYIEAQNAPLVNFAWQGGEPTLMGIDFYRQAVELQKKYAEGKTITNAFQTNAILLDDAWGEFLSENRFLVGLSIDGPKECHDRYRVDKGQKPTYDRVKSGLDILKKHGVEFNTLTVLQNHNVARPMEVYRFLREMGSGFIQFIPIVERFAHEPQKNGLEWVGPEFEGRASVSKWSVGPTQFGKFLCTIFDEWVRKDVGRVFVQIFDVALGSWLGQASSLCLFAETCGKALIIEHNGDLYSCDHFVFPEYRLGNVHEQTIHEMVNSSQQVKFGRDKKDKLPQPCRRCDFRFACNGGCPKHRFTNTSTGKKRANHLCKGYKMFFSHVNPFMHFMANELRQGRPASGVMEWTRYHDEIKRSTRPKKIGRNDPCPCGSGKKFKRCCATAAGNPYR